MAEELKVASLPIVDIGPFLCENESRESRQSFARSIFAACRDPGFFYLTGHGIPDSTLQAVLQASRQFFLESSDDQKARISRQDPGQGQGDGARGFQRIGENVTSGKRDWHEAVDFYAEESDSTSEPPYELLKGKNLWPDHPPELKELLTNYVEEAKKVGTALVQAMGAALDLGEEEDIFVRNTRESFWVMRIIGYPSLPQSNGVPNGEDIETFSCGTHTDYGCVTLLLTDDTPGALQVQARTGSWINADPIPGAFVVNIGDMMETWTNGLWKSTKHRVIHRGTSYRVSVPFFFEPNWSAIIRPLEKCVEYTGGEMLYKEVKYCDHLIEKVSGNFY